METSYSLAYRIFYLTNLSQIWILWENDLKCCNFSNNVAELWILVPIQHSEFEKLPFPHPALPQAVQNKYCVEAQTMVVSNLLMMLIDHYSVTHSLQFTVKPFSQQSIYIFWGGGTKKMENNKVFKFLGR